MSDASTNDTDSARAVADPAEALPSERRIVVAVWPTLIASAVGLLPFTVFSTYLVAIADAVGDSDAAVGALRGLGGIGAVLAGVALAPLIGRIAPGRVAAAALLLLAVAAVAGTLSWIPTLAVFCLLTGVSNALLYPALSTAAADRFGSGPAAARAATLVMSAQTLAATSAAPLIALPALWWGWQGDLLAIAVLALLLTPLLFRYGRAEHSATARGRRPGYLAAFSGLAAVPGARALLLVAFARAGAFMGNLAFLGALYHDRFALSPTVFALVWSLSGGSFFLGHLVAGRVLNTEVSDRRAHRVMLVSLLTALAALLAVYLVPMLPVALAGTAVLSASHAVIAAGVVTLLVHRCGDLRGTALSLNASGMSLGLFVGTGLAGAGLAVAGYPGAAAVLGALTVVAVVALLTLRPRAEPHPGPA